MKHEIIPANMTVKDLIAILSKHDPNTVITISEPDDDKEYYYTIENVTYGSSVYTNDEGKEEYGKILNLR